MAYTNTDATFETIASVKVSDKKVVNISKMIKEGKVAGIVFGQKCLIDGKWAHMKGGFTLPQDKVTDLRNTINEVLQMLEDEVDETQAVTSQKKSKSKVKK